MCPLGWLLEGKLLYNGPLQRVLTIPGSRLG